MVLLTFPWLITGSLVGSAIILVILVLSMRWHLSAKNQIQLLSLKLAQLNDAKLLQENQLNEALTRHRELELSLNEQNIKNAALNEKLTLLTIYQTKNLTLENELSELRGKYTTTLTDLSELKTRLEETRSAGDEKLQLLEQSELRLTEQFENLAMRIFSNNSKQLEEKQSQSLHHLLSPLKDQLDNFKKQVQDSFGQEAKERHTLTSEIQNLQQLNLQMTKEAVNLTNALKGNNKTQGNWGEIILSRILDSSGLREGHEYETQVSLPNEFGKKQQPDVIVHLPHGKDVIIDAKVTLVAYERYFNSDDGKEKDIAIREHLNSIKQHMKNLGEKNYHQLASVKSLDYILMFIPIEPAFLTAMNHDPSLMDESLKRNIIIVSPTTLLVALRTINNLWRHEYQNRHAQAIAEKAAKLYDKMRGFIEDMEYLGTHIKRSQKSYEDAMNKLATGRGNAIGQIEQFRELGITIKKQISPSIAKVACDEFLGEETEQANKTNIK